jgi:hypothetical protein
VNGPALEKKNKKKKKKRSEFEGVPGANEKGETYMISKTTVMGYAQRPTHDTLQTQHRGRENRTIQTLRHPSVLTLYPDPSQFAKSLRFPSFGRPSCSQ